MIEKLEILRASQSRGLAGSSYVLRYAVGARQLESDATEEAAGDVVKVTNSLVVQIDRTPNTERHAVASALVRWRGVMWRISGREEVKRRTAYKLTLESTSR